MTERPIIWFLFRYLPLPFSGRSIHRAALSAFAAGRTSMSAALLERAASRYRAEIRVQRLARLRVHQMYVLASATEDPDRRAELAYEMEKALQKLTAIESLKPPHRAMDARAARVAWILELATTPQVDDADEAEALVSRAPRSPRPPISPPDRVAA